MEHGVCRWGRRCCVATPGLGRTSNTADASRPSRAASAETSAGGLAGLTPSESPGWVLAPDPSTPSSQCRTLLSPAALVVSHRAAMSGAWKGCSGE